MYSTLSPDNTINANTNNEPSVLKFEFETRQTDTFQCEEQTLLRIKNEITAENESKKNSTEILQDEEAEVTNGGWAWFIIMGALTLRIIVGGLWRSDGIFYKRFMERFNGSATATALVTSITGLVRLGGGPFVSILCTKIPCRFPTFLGACLLTIGLILTGYSPSLEFLYFSYGVVCGLGRAFALTPVPILLGYYFKKRRSLAFGVATAGYSLGGFMLIPVVETLFENVGYSGTFLLLGGFTLNVTVCAALFRPVVLHMKIRQHRFKRCRKTTSKSNEHIEKSNKVNGQSLTTSSGLADQGEATSMRSDFQFKSDRTSDRISDRKINKYSMEVGELDSSKGNALNESGKHETICLKAEVSWNDKDMEYSKKHCDISEKNRETRESLIAWSIFRDFRFLCFCLSTFLVTLPSGALFLPSLAEARGVTDLKAASLLSINSGSDTLFRVISGFVLDLKTFRQIRPQIYSTVMLMHGLITIFYPFMTSFSALVILCLFDGMFAGLTAAQNSVVVMDILGVDKLASSMVVTMSVQALAVIIGPSTSGYLKDLSGVYDGAFYFSGAAVLLAGLVLMASNVRKYILDKHTRLQWQTEE